MSERRVARSPRCACRLLTSALWLAAIYGAAAPLWANACVSLGSGSWSNPAIWSSCGGKSPDDGDSASINGKAVVIDRNIGSTSAGIHNIQVINGGSLTVDGLAPRIITFGSTGNDPVGSGSNLSPGANATMYGFLIDGGTFDLSNATAANYVVIGPANPAYGTYVRHVQFGGNVNQAAVIRLHYTVLNYLGVNVDGFYGVYDNSTQTGEVLSIDHCLFQHSYEALFLRSINGASFTFNTIAGTTSAQSVDCYQGNDNAVFTDNTELGVAANGTMFQRFYVGSGQVFARNAVQGNTSFARSLLTDNTAAYYATTSPDTIQQNLAVSYAGGEFAHSGGINLASNAYAPIVDSNVIVNSQVAVFDQGCPTGCIGGATGPATITNNIFIQSAYDTDSGQGMIMIQRGLATVIGNLFAADSTTNTGLSGTSNGIFCWDAGSGTSALLADHNTISLYTPGAQYGWGVVVGEPGYPCNGTPIVRNNITYGGTTGIFDFAANTWAQNYSGVGSHHNNVAGSTTPYQSQGTSKNFTANGTPHPNAVYGDVTINPGLADITRRVAGFDARVGGAGTDNDYFLMLANRCGLTGFPYNPAYDIANLYNWMRAGYAPTEIRLANLASDGAQIGAMKPIGLIGAFIP